MATRFYYDGHSYLIGSTTQNWSDAATSWSWSDGHLAIISSLDENTAIHDVAAQVFHHMRHMRPMAVMRYTCGLVLQILQMKGVGNGLMVLR